MQWPDMVFSVPRPETEPGLQQWKHWILTTRPIGYPLLFFFMIRKTYVSPDLSGEWKTAWKSHDFYYQDHSLQGDHQLCEKTWRAPFLISHLSPSVCHAIPTSLWNSPCISFSTCKRKLSFDSCSLYLKGSLEKKLVYAPWGIWNAWPMETCCIAQRTLPSILW